MSKNLPENTRNSEYRQLKEKAGENIEEKTSKHSEDRNHYLQITNT